MRKGGQEPRKRVSWGIPDTEYYYKPDELQSSNSGSNSCHDITLTSTNFENTAACEDVNNFVGSGYNKEIFEMNMNSILNETGDTSNFKDIVALFNCEAGPLGMENEHMEPTQVENEINGSTIIENGLGEQVDLFMASENFPNLKENSTINNGLSRESNDFALKNSKIREEQINDLSFLSSAGDTGTIRIDEVINTMDLRNIVGDLKKEISIDEQLESFGVRFYHQAANINRPRDTISKQSTKPSSELILYYEKFLSPRIFFFNEFITFLEEEMKEEDKNTKINEKLINANIFKEEGIDKKIKIIKQLCRTKSKIKWYEIRTNREIGFNLTISENKSELVKLYENTDKEFIRLQNEISELNTAIANITERFENMENLNSKGHIINNTSKIANLTQNTIDELSDKDQIDRISKLKSEISEKEQIIDSCKAELRKIDDHERDLESEYENLLKERNLLIEEVGDLESSIKSKNVSEGDLTVVKQKYDILNSLFSIDLINLKHNLFEILIGPFNCLFRLQEHENRVTIQVTKIEISNSNTPMKPIYDLLISKCNFANCRLSPSISKIQRISILARSLVKELKNFELSYEVIIYDKNDSVEVIIKVVQMAIPLLRAEDSSKLGDSGDASILGCVENHVKLVIYDCDNLEIQYAGEVVESFRLNDFGSITDFIERFNKMVI